MAPNDVDFVYAVLKFVQRLGLSSSHHHALVMSVQDLWRRVSSKMSQNKRVRYRVASNAANGGGQNGSAAGAGGDMNGGGIFGQGKAMPSRA